MQFTSVTQLQLHARKLSTPTTKSYKISRCFKNVMSNNNHPN